MGSVYKETYTRSLPADAELFTKAGQQFARCKGKTGRKQVFPVTVGRDGSQRLVVESPTYVAKYRDGAGVVCKVSTGCRDEDAARSILRDLERRSELVRAGVMSSSEDSIADQQAVPLAEHFRAYLDHLRARQVSPVRIKNMQSQFDRVTGDCGFRRLSDFDGAKLTKWLVQRQSEGMSAATRNGYRETLVMFANWCCSGTRPRLLANPFTDVPKANRKTDTRRQRRAMTEAELNRLILVARWRPLAEHGRESIEGAGQAGMPHKRSNWKKAELTLEGLSEAVSLARMRLADNPELIEKLDRLGRERALIFKVLVLTGLRKGELGSLTVGQVVLNGSLPCLILNAADEKNGRGSTIPLRADLIADLREWLADAPKPTTLRLRDHNAMPDPSRKLFAVPSGLVRILDRDLRAAGIPKRDERGRTIDVHALRTTFGTLLSKGGVAPRTAQAAMRHSCIDLTMNTYTDPKLLDVQGAVDSLPMLQLPTDLSTRQRQTLRATGTDPMGSGSLVPTLVPTSGQSSPNRSFPVIASAIPDESTEGQVSDENTAKPKKKPSFAGFANKGQSIGATGFEPATSTSRT